MSLEDDVDDFDSGKGRVEFWEDATRLRRCLSEETIADGGAADLEAAFGGVSVSSWKEGVEKEVFGRGGRGRESEGD